MQFRLSNLFADYPFAKAWGLPLLNIMVGIEVEKPVGHNWPPLFIMRHQLFHWIARVMAR